MSTLRYTQGFTLKKEVNNDSAFLVALNPVAKIEVRDILVDNGKYYLIADSSVTSGWLPTSYDYQIQDDEGIQEQGRLVILKNLALATPATSQSIWEKALSDIDAVIAGRVKNSSNQISVGDKHITYSSFEELLRLRDWILGRIAEEKAEEGEEAFNPNNGMTIKYWWR